MSIRYIYILENLIPKPRFPSFSWKGLSSTWQLSAGGEVHSTAQFISSADLSNPGIFFLILDYGGANVRGRALRGASWQGSCCWGGGGLLRVSLPSRRGCPPPAASLAQTPYPRETGKGWRRVLELGGAGRERWGSWWQNGEDWGKTVPAAKRGWGNRQGWWC